MAQVETTNSGHHGDKEHSFDTKAIWRTFWILLVITCIELVIGMFIAPSFPHNKKIWFNILYIIFTGAKAFYIIAEFMHLRHEIKNMVMTIAVPAAVPLVTQSSGPCNGSFATNNTRSRRVTSSTGVEPSLPGSMSISR